MDYSKETKNKTTSSVGVLYEHATQQTSFTP